MIPDEGRRIGRPSFHIRGGEMVIGIRGIGIQSAAIAIALLFLLPSLCPAASSTLTVSATVLSKSNCKFSTATSALAFGSLDPGNPVDVTVSTTIGFRCMGSAPVATFLITDDDGLHEILPAGNRMQHVALPAQFLPYEMTLAPVTGTVPKNVPQTLTVTGTVRGASYQNAYAGNYADTVVISIAP